MIGISGPQVCKTAGITYRQLDYWARTDLIRPSVIDAKGSGTRRLYSLKDVFLLAIVKEWLAYGMSLRHARHLLSSLAAQLPEDPLASSDLFLVWGSDGVLLTDDPEDVGYAVARSTGITSAMDLNPLASRLLDALAPAAPAV